MSNINIETLTAVHIGSGNSLQYGNDFIRDNIIKDKVELDVLGIVDPAKILELIGVDHIPQWTAAIERNESAKKIVHLYAPNSKLSDYTSRFIINFTSIKNSDTLKEHIHDGRGIPYIPGSSIKGAIRTAILSSLINNSSEQFEDKIKERTKDGREKKDRNGNCKLSADTIENELFGNDPKVDVFRFLQIGDAYFGNNYEIAIRMVNINERKRESYWDTSKSQLIEAISNGDKTTFQIKINSALYNFAQSKVHSLPECMTSIPALFSTINNHTKHLIDEELTYWNEQSINDHSGNVDVYMEKIGQIQKEIMRCKDGKECVLRIGHGSGWRFITGAWSEKLNSFNPVVMSAARPNNFRYSEYNFPKTRRVDEECELLGFVKLTNNK